MELQEILRQRYSVRDFLQKPIEPEKLERILEAGRLAPTAKNNQPQRIYVLESEEALGKIRGITRCAFNAPVVLLIAVDTAEQWTNPFEPEITSGRQDAAIVATQMMLAAWDEGIGSCWVCYMPNAAVKAAFALPENEEPVLLLPIGYSAQEKPSPNHGRRKALSETVARL